MEKVTRKKKLGGYPAVGVVTSVTLALFAIGLFSLLILYSKKLEDEVRRNIKMEVYLRSNLTSAQRLQVEKQLLSLPYFASQQEHLKFISKEEAAKKFIAETGEDFTAFLGENPLRDAYLISVDRAYHTGPQMDSIKTQVAAINGVFQVYYQGDVIESVNDNVAKIGLFLAGLILILLITVALLINNTLRIALFSQRFLIRSMQLVGATRWFIQRPFLFRAAGYGILGGIIASILLWLATNYAHQKIADLKILHREEEFMMLVGGLLVAGIILVVISTLISIQKYLRMSLDELY